MQRGGAANGLPWSRPSLVSVRYVFPLLARLGSSLRPSELLSGGGVPVLSGDTLIAPSTTGSSGLSPVPPIFGSALSSQRPATGSHCVFEFPGCPHGVLNVGALGPDVGARGDVSALQYHISDPDSVPQVQEGGPFSAGRLEYLLAADH